jgi:hypothetical protein
MKKLIITVEAESVHDISMSGVPAGAKVSIRVEDSVGIHTANAVAPFAPDSIKPLKVFSHIVTKNPKDAVHFRLRRWENEDRLRQHLKNGWKQCSSCVMLTTSTAPQDQVHRKRTRPTELVPCDALQEGRVSVMIPLHCKFCGGFYSVGGYPATNIPCPDCIEGDGFLVRI